MGNYIVSVIIITYNNEREIIPCLRSLPWVRIPMEVWIADNHSTDTTVSMIDAFKHQHPHYPVHTFKNSLNLGFAYGVNQALSRVNGQYILLLGSDTELIPGAVQTMIRFLKEHPKVGLVAPQLIDFRGTVLRSCRRFPTYTDLLLELTGLPRLPGLRLLPRWKNPGFDHQTQRSVEQPEATCLMTRSQYVTAIGKLDERFSMFFNDVDWCKRFKDEGFEIIFIPTATVKHLQGITVYNNRIPMIWKSHQGFYRYFEKYASSSLQHILNHILGFLLIYTATVRSLICLFTYRGKQNNRPYR